MKKVVIKQCIMLDCWCPNSTITVITKMDFGGRKIRHYLSSMLHSNPWDILNGLVHPLVVFLYLTVVTISKIQALATWNVF